MATFNVRKSNNKNRTRRFSCQGFGLKSVSMRTSAPAAHQRDVSIARPDEKAAQVSVLHVGQDHQGHWQSTLLFSLEGDTCRTTAVMQLSQWFWSTANSLKLRREDHGLTEESDYVFVVKVLHELCFSEELLKVVMAVGSN